MADSETPIYRDVVEWFREEHDADIRDIREREPWSLAAAKARVGELPKSPV